MTFDKKTADVAAIVTLHKAYAGDPDRFAEIINLDSEAQDPLITLADELRHRSRKAQDEVPSKADSQL